MKWLLAAVLYLLLVSPATAVLMTLDQPRITAGEKLKILVEARTSQATEPELEWPAQWEEHLQLLEKDHQAEALPRGDYQHRWFLTWQHRDAQTRSRELSLPPLRVNGRSAQRLQLQISANPDPEPVQPSRRLSAPLEVDHQVERQEVYLGESLLYQLTIRYQGYPRDPRLSPLEVQGGYSRSLGDGHEEGFNQRGVHWQEARWREIVQINQLQAGIQPRYFSTRLDRSDQTGGERHEAEAPAIDFKVLPIPEAWPEETPWLPALGVSLEATWQGNTANLVPGQPVELLVELTAVGQQARSLPRFQPEDLPGVRIEPLAEHTRDRVIDGYLAGRLTQRLLVYPLQAGPLVLPPLKVYWWDTDRKRLQSSEISPPRLSIKPGQAQLERSEQPASLPIEATPPPDWGRILVGLLTGLLLVLLACAGWWLLRQRPASRLRRHLKEGPEYWSHRDLLHLAETWHLGSELEFLLIQAAAGKRISRKELLRPLLSRSKKAEKGAALPPLNP
ncbi:hypothetical protein [Marinospirillum sp.]|uniref:hypothetical protein n=1 Tax=Marinospirillum sp. TaxID=2183934 RepID=UPI0028700A49|nr:hypothetical protein [Marinospirillum sp.]MDR9469317.1 hypothetical protein [Marinospirillum sp.]